MRLLLPHIILLLTSITITAQTITWQKVYGDAGEDVGLSITQVFDGGYVMCGRTLPPDGNRIVRTDKFGNVIWNIVRDGFPLRKIIQTSDSNFVLVGFSRESVTNSLQGYVVKIDTGGNLIWWREYGSQSRKDVFNDVLLRTDGNLMVLGSFGSAMYLIKLDFEGNPIWDRTYDTTGQGLSIHEVESRGYLLTGSTELYVDYEGRVKYSSPYLGVSGVSTSESKGFLFFQNIDGHIEVAVTDTTLSQVSTFPIGVPGRLLFGNQMIRSGKHFVIGGSSIALNSDNDEDAYLVKFDIYGNAVWTGNIQGRFQYNERINDVSVCSDSGFIAVGYTSHFIGTTDILAIKTDRMGNTVPVSILENRNIESVEFDLYQNYPNPFNSTTVISYALTSNSYVELSLFDVSGRKVMTLEKRFMNEGRYNYLLNSNDLHSGVYFYQMTVKNSKCGNSCRISKTLLLLK